MRLTSSLTNRIFLACLLLATLSLGSAFYFVNARASREAEAEVRRGLAEAGALVDENRASLTDTFARMARLVADLPKLKAAMSTGDPPTVQPVADDYRGQLKADVLVLTNVRGTVLAATGSDLTSLPDAVHEAASTREFSTFWTHPHGLLQIISVPVVLEGDSPETLGRLTVGFFLDEERASELKRLTGSEIAFGAAGRILASTFPTSVWPALGPLLHTTSVSSLTIDGEDFLALTRPLVSSPGTASVSTPLVLVLRSQTERLRFLSTIRTGLAGALIVTLILSTIVSYGVARTMTRPLTAITRAMRDVADTGDLTRKVALTSRPWDDEDARLLASTFNTLTESIARFQEEGAQRDRLSSLGRLSTVIAHEVRNPLMIIKTALRALRRTDLTDHERREAIADIDEETSRLNRIVTEVLDFAKPIQFELADTDINDLCRESADAASAGEPPHDIAVDLDPSLPIISTDPERLRTALVNMLANARQAVVAAGSPDAAAPAGKSQAPPVTLMTRRAGAGVQICIRDSGVGISPADMAHIFDPYFTTRRTGTGLGLPIAKNIIEGLGGRLEVVSRPGEGTDIRFELPRAPAERA